MDGSLARNRDYDGNYDVEHNPLPGSRSYERDGAVSNRRFSGSLSRDLLSALHEMLSRDYGGLPRGFLHERTV